MDLTFGLEAFTVDPVKDLLAATAALSSTILNFSTLTFVFQTVNNGVTARGESCFPNIVCAGNALLSFYYEKIMLDWALMTAGLIACICYSCYIFIYIQYCPRESIITTQTMLIGLWLLLFSSNYIFSIFGADVHISSVGFLCAVSVFINVFLLPVINFIFPSPYLPAKTPFETRVSFIMALSWSAYGAKISDNNVVIPNVLGLFLSLVLIILQVNDKKLIYE